MGSIFNTPGTLAIINLLSTTFTQNFATAAANPGLINDLEPASLISSYDFAKKYGLVTGNAAVDAHWKVWLDYFDLNGGDIVRAAMLSALENPKYEAIEFFAFQDTSFVPSASAHKNKNTGKHSLIVSVKTPTYDQL
jgi:hypothetical protein